MKYYNEVKAERAIRRKASWITFWVLAITLSGMILLVSEEAQELLIDPVKEWLETPAEQPTTPTKRA